MFIAQGSLQIAYRLRMMACGWAQCDSTLLHCFGILSDGFGLDDTGTIMRVPDKSRPILTGFHSWKQSFLLSFLLSDKLLIADLTC